MFFTDINKCLAYPCSPDATCNDIPGLYACTCNVGYNGDGYNCTGKMFYFVSLVKHFRQWHQFSLANVRVKRKILARGNISVQCLQNFNTFHVEMYI